MSTARITESRLLCGYRTVVFENDLMSATVLPEKGADIHALVYKPRAMDVLWKSPWGVKQTAGTAGVAAGDSEAAWMDIYPGGWQEIFPNGGDACLYKGARLSFHGEASVSEWDYSIVRSQGSAVEAVFTVRLARSPFVLRRTMRLEAGRAELVISERVTNQGEEELQFMWGHHPAYGAPFLGAGCRLEVGATTFEAHSPEVSPNVRVTAGTRGEWPRLVGKHGSSVDLSRVPSPEERATEFGYLSGIEEGRYRLTSQEHGFGVELAWPTAVFPYLWFWQELRGSFGYPWYGRCYVMAVEPFTSIPGSGLVNAIERGTAPLLQAGQMLDAELGFRFFEDSGNRRALEAPGLILRRKKCGGDDT